MVIFNCKYCGYSIERESLPKKCPYCSREKAMDKESNAEDLLSDV